MFEPSEYQKAIFTEVERGSGNKAINAVAGSGKTTTIVEASSLIHSDNALFLAFNKSIVAELGKRLPKGIECKTNHSLGMSAVRSFLVRNGRKKIKVRPNKYKDIIQESKDDIIASVEQRLRQEGLGQAQIAKTAYKSLSALQKLVGLAQLTLTSSTDFDNLLIISYHYGLDSEFEYPHLLLDWVDEILYEGRIIAKHALEIDFNDMLYLPAVYDLTPKQYDWLFVDECQDLNRAQLSLIQSALSPGGRAIFVGDKRQAIYGFAGADNQSFQNIVKGLKCTELPLSICYRCPSSHVSLAQKIVPEIKPSPNAIEGVVDSIKKEKLLEPGTLKCGDIIISRITAPLISLCIQLISQRIPARVKGRDIGKQLIAIAEEVSVIPSFSYKSFPQHLDDYFQEKVARLTSLKNSESAVQSLEDKCNGLLACWEGFIDSTNISELCKGITALFDDEETSITLATVHRTKGLEADRVFILKPNKLPLTWKNQLEWQYEQEVNLKYVALTRAKKELYFVYD